MGVRGLTTYINQNPTLFFKKYKLHNTYLIIDGYCLATKLYLNVPQVNSTFGGEYVHYARLIEKFMMKLLKCEITPIIIIDGSYERKKLKTVRKRNEVKVVSLNGVTPVCACSYLPILMRQAFRDILMELNIIIAQCDAEADSEIAALARKLNCPILSSDSDFYIYDVQYIPIDKMDSAIFTTVDKDGKKFHYINCSMYKVDYFLKNFGYASKDILPLLPAILGNDYINRHVFNKFYNLLRIPNKRHLHKTAARVTHVLKWFRKETLDSAIKKILLCFKMKQRQKIYDNLVNIINGYIKLDTVLDTYLDLNIKWNTELEYNSIIKQFDELVINNDESNEESSAEESDNDQNESDIENENDISDEELNSEITCKILHPKWFEEMSRKAMILGPILTLKNLKIYFTSPQIEDYYYDHAGQISICIIKFLAGILLGKTKFKYYFRNGSVYNFKNFNTFTFLKNFGTLPKFEDINTLRIENRRSILLEILQLESVDNINKFPENWKLLILSIIFWSKNSDNPLVHNYHVYSIIVMIIVINIIGSKTEFCKNEKTFNDLYSKKLKNKNSTVVNTDDDNKNIMKLLNCLTQQDCLVVYKKCLSHFNVDVKLKLRPKLFDTEIIHVFAQLQSVIESVNLLNSVLLFPFEICHINKFYSGTFLYNCATTLKKKINIEDYITKLFSEGPIILLIYETIKDCLKDSILCLNELCNLYGRNNRRKKNKKNNEKATDYQDKSDSETETENFIDENNKYSILMN